jgi:SAM-dependent methyltransferase
MNHPVDRSPDSRAIKDRGRAGRNEASAFDRYASSYEEALARGLSITGESSEYFARGRVAWLAQRLHVMAMQPKKLLDFGCGTGAAVPFFRELLSVESVIGVDNSECSLALAREVHGGEAARFLLPEEYRPNGEVDLAFTNGVFHHIPPSNREHVARYIFRALMPGGLFAFWENNPWNPGARYVMWRIPFDRDAVPVWPFQARTLLRASGFEILRTDFLFVFPRLLRWLRWIEPRLVRCPFGAQYQILSRKPSTAS